MEGLLSGLAKLSFAYFGYEIIKYKKLKDLEKEIKTPLPVDLSYEELNPTLADGKRNLLISSSIKFFTNRKEDKHLDIITNIEELGRNTFKTKIKLNTDILIDTNENHPQVLVQTNKNLIIFLPQNIRVEKVDSSTNLSSTLRLHFFLLKNIFSYKK